MPRVDSMGVDSMGLIAWVELRGAWVELRGAGWHGEAVREERRVGRGGKAEREEVRRGHAVLLHSIVLHDDISRAPKHRFSVAVILPTLRTNVRTRKGELGLHKVRKANEEFALEVQVAEKRKAALERLFRRMDERDQLMLKDSVMNGMDGPTAEAITNGKGPSREETTIDEVIAKLGQKPTNRGHHIQIGKLVAQGCCERV
eukprot:813522-Rhodomonas_salina.1